MYTLPDLEYDYGALSPSISADIMKLHHDTHHSGYVNKLNAALEGKEDLAAQSLLELVSSTSSIDDVKLSTSIRNQGGGHLNHSLFWQWMNPNGGGEPSGKLLENIKAKYGDFQGFVGEFTTKSMSVFGSGWCWLMPNMDIITTANQDNPIMQGKELPVLGLDVWEHAYYLDYKSKRDDYIKAWWDVIDWARIESEAVAV